VLSDKFEKCPPIGGFCEFYLRLYTPNLNNLSAKSPIVSIPHMKYSRFGETLGGDYSLIIPAARGRQSISHTDKVSSNNLSVRGSPSEAGPPLFLAVRRMRKQIRIASSNLPRSASQPQSSRTSMYKQVENPAVFLHFPRQRNPAADQNRPSRSPENRIFSES